MALARGYAMARHRLALVNFIIPALFEEKSVGVCGVGGRGIVMPQLCMSVCPSVLSLHCC